MDSECPLCNALININEICPKCSSKMDDMGPVKDYLDPYSPYLEKPAAKMAGEHRCNHLFCCPNCGYDTHILVNDIPT
ncbi:MAG TPA: hypothetical protein GX534_09195 [Thermoanaerobacterales bacterium]|jgi:hypothetical protein|nr:hypothetical protein [Thermoanaerobacterales bacterium]